MNCTDLPKGYQCSCRAGYELQANKRNCAPIAYNQIGMNRTVNCTIRNGGCPQICIRGTNGSLDRCGCKPGFTLSKDNKDCLDIDECAMNATICKPHICMNGYSNYSCVTLTFGSTNPQPLQDAQRVDDVVERVGSIDGSVDSVSQNSSRLAILYYVLVAWVIVVTICLVAFAIVALRRHARLRGQRRDEMYEDSVSSASTKHDIGSYGDPVSSPSNNDSQINVIS